jgi:sensor histidine kinase YesM
MGKQKLIPVSQEIKLVEDYLAVESYRYEERLRYNLNIKPDTLGFLVPPLMLQTLVENGIKHGISKLPKGGELNLDIHKANDFLEVSITNSGHFNPNSTTDTGFGLENTRERLKILFGKTAKLTITNASENTVLTQIIIPLKTGDYEN